MVPKMDNAKKKVSSKKNTKTSRIKASTRYKIVVASIITFVVIVVGGFLCYETGLPAHVLTGATVAGESIKVNEINYHFFEAYSMYYQYGVITSKSQLDNVYDTSTGATYRDYLYEVAVQNEQNIVLLNNEAKKDGFVSQVAARRVAAYVKSLRSYASTNKTTADAVIKNQYGIGITLRDLESFMTRELTAEEYGEYLKQSKYSLTEDQMKAMYEAAPENYDTVTFNAYFVAASIDANATADQKTAAVSAAKASAQTIIGASTDAQSFRDASATAAGTAGASKFADNADPTINTKSPKATIESSFNTDVSAYLYSADRKAGDVTVITTDSGAYAIYFQSRQLDTGTSVSYRSLLVTDTDTVTARAKVDEYQKQVTDEASFTDLVKKYSDDADTSIAGGLVSNATSATLVKDSPTDAEKALSDWLLSADRKPGDMTIIENIDGVTLYYFTKSLPAWEGTLSTSNASTEYQKWYTSLTSASGNGYTINKGNLKFATY
jgi:hypothetical protein